MPKLQKNVLTQGGLQNGVLGGSPAARCFPMFAGQTKPFLLLTSHVQRPRLGERKEMGIERAAGGKEVR